jgi:four helix bundle protein
VRWERGNNPETILMTQSEKSKDKPDFHQELKSIMDGFVNKVYDVTKSFPKDEVFGITSQLKRASMPVVLNYIEGYARKRRAVFRNFLEMSYGSLKESDYLIYFSYNRGYVSKDDYQELVRFTDRIGKMLWGILNKISD